MKYSGFIDEILAEAAFANKTGDTSVLERMMHDEEDLIKRNLLHIVCTPRFIESVKRNSEWFNMQKNYLETLALEHVEDDEVSCFLREMEEQVKDDDETETQDSTTPGGASGPAIEAGFGLDDTGAQDAEEGDNENDGNETEDSDQDEDGKEADEELGTNEGMPNVWGKGRGIEQVLKLENQILRHIPSSLKHLARMIGRTGGFDIQTGKVFSKAAKSDISGITIGDDLNSLLPNEVALLSDQRTQDVFYKNYAEKRLQVFASASSSEKAKERQDGPVIICLDTSGSMHGEPAVVACMLSMAVSIYAMRRKRKVMIIKYSDTYQMETFTKRRSERSKLIDFLKIIGSGGNNENVMFKDLFERILPLEPKFETADILCISDFGWSRLRFDVLDLIQKAKNDGMKFYGLAVGDIAWVGKNYNESMSLCDSKWMWLGGECVNIDQPNNPLTATQ